MRFNPFNYTKPVNGENFRGRPGESGQIDYYLGEATSGSLINMAILGPTQIGKTSLLNYARFKAEQVGILSIQISEWEYSEAETHNVVSLALRKLLSAIDDRFRAGLGSTTFELLPTESHTLETPFQDEESSTILLDSEDLLTRIQSIFARDPSLKVMLTLDDIGCTPGSMNVLAHLVRLSERLPIFLIIATTEDFVDFSVQGQHIASRFTKIRLAPFADQEQTYEVIREALSDAADPDEPIKLDFKTLSDIHILSDGNPREIHLIAHHISKAFADGRTEKFEITPMF